MAGLVIKQPDKVNEREVDLLPKHLLSLGIAVIGGVNLLGPQYPTNDVQGRSPYRIIPTVFVVYRALPVDKITDVSPLHVKDFS
jgi:hypothetical protein